MCERAGVVNIGIEGMILTAAFVAFLSLAPTSTRVVGGADAGHPRDRHRDHLGDALSLLHAWLSITIKADQIISGTVINILALGVHRLLQPAAGLDVRAVRHEHAPAVQRPREVAEIPIIGPIIKGSSTRARSRCA